MLMRSSWSPLAVILVLLMAVGSVVMWIGVPVGLIYLASRVADSSQPSAGPYLLVLIGLRSGWRSSARFLGTWTGCTGALTGRDEERHRATWLRSMRAERGSTRRAACSTR